MHLKPFFGVLRAFDVGTELVTRYTDARQQEGASDALINRELSILKRMFSLGTKATPPKVLRAPYIPMLKEDNVRTGFLEPAQHDRLAAECSSTGLWLRVIFGLGYTFGLRLGEILGLRVRHVDLVHKSLRLEDTKNGDARTIILTDALAVLLLPLMVGKDPEDHVFTRTDGNAVRSFRKAWKRACARAGVPGLLFHDLRRTAVRGMTRRGVTEHVAMKITGHKTRSVFDRYDIVAEAELREAARKLEQPEGADRSRIGHVAQIGESQPAAQAVN